MVQPDQTRDPVKRLAVEIKRLQQRITTLEQGGFRIPILDADPVAADPTSMWMFNDGRLRARDASDRLREWGPMHSFALQMTGAWPTAVPGPTSGTAFTLSAGGTLRGIAIASGFSTLSSTPITVQVYIDGTLVATSQLNNSVSTGVHLTTNAAAFAIALDAGVHYLYFRQTSGTSNAGDFGAAFGVISPDPGAALTSDPKPVVPTPHQHQVVYAPLDATCFCPVHGVEDDLYFGDLDATHGERLLMFTFDWATIQSDLAGATIDAVELDAGTLEAFGPQVQIAWGGHAEATMPAVYHQVYEDVWRDTWPQVGGFGWRTMPQWFGKSLRDGVITGLVVNQPSTSAAFYGRLDPDVSLRITYSHAH